MKKKWLLVAVVVVLGMVAGFELCFASSKHLPDPYKQSVEVAQDTFPISPRFGDFINDAGNNPFDLKDPAAIEQNVEYDAATGYYIVTERIGDSYYRAPTYMTFQEYMDWRAKQQEQAYFDKLSGVSKNIVDADVSVFDPIAKIDVQNDLIDRLFGGTAVDIRPEGNVNIDFGVDFQNIENPILLERQRRNGGFDFDMDINMNVTGSIGDKLKLNTNYNTLATFDFENKLKLEYDADEFGEDEIIRKIEAGNVSLPLNNSLIQGSQALFGLKTQLQFGRLSVTAVASQQKSKRSEIQVEGGSQIREFEVPIDDYDEFQHYFISHYNRANFEGALVNLPQIKSLFDVQNIEVWVTNRQNVTTDVRDIIALTDLGEANIDKITNHNYDPPAVPRIRDIFGNGLPENRANDLYQDILDRESQNIRKAQDAVRILEGQMGLKQTRDFVKVQARKLSPQEFDVHRELGFISINVNLQPSDVVGVSIKYCYNGCGEQSYNIGEFSDEHPRDTNGISEILFVKLLKSTTQQVNNPIWDLMMKNIYNIGAFQVDPLTFELDINYDDPGKGKKRFLPESNQFGIPLLTLFNLDRLNSLGDQQPDGRFDFVEPLTINTRTGRIMFPKVEPFGEALAAELDAPYDAIYPYRELYDSTLVVAREFPEKNRFLIKGRYKSSVSSEIRLGAFNLPRNSVKVYQGGIELQEGRDYEIDYNIGVVRIINESLLISGQPIRVSFEDNALFGFQTKTMLGARLDYKINDNFNIGGTFIQLFERPFTQKVNIGDDPINNKIYGLDVNYSSKAPWLTKLVDKIPLIDTKEESNISLQFEAAALKPGHAKAINLEQGSKGGSVYLDDFEGSTNSIDLKFPTTSWALASVPQDVTEFPESVLSNNIAMNANRALMNWYFIEDNLRNDDPDSRINPYTRSVDQREIFPDFNVPSGNAFLFQARPFNMSYYPSRRGPYNFDIPGGRKGADNGQISQGTQVQNDSLFLNDPKSRWGGIMRAINTTDFESANIEYLEFWMLSPFILDDQNPGKLVIQLGDVSEDILRDSRKFFENGLPGDGTDDGVELTSWSRVPINQQITNSFDNDTGIREQQDVGFDGMSNSREQQEFSDYLNAFPNLPSEVANDPSGDDFLHFRDRNLVNNSLLSRYARFNNPQGNSQSDPSIDNLSASSNLPDSEDLDRDNSLNESEAYYQYEIDLIPSSSPGLIDEASARYVTDVVGDRTYDDTGIPERWYRFKIPIDQFTKRVGDINDFRSIRFVRMYMSEFQNPVTLRFARFDLVRNQWRRYDRDTARTDIVDNSCLTDDGGNIAFDVNAVNFEEHGRREPFKYVLPPGIDREQSLSGFADALQNEQSLAMNLCGLFDGSAKAIYKIINFDMRLYERLRMFVHAEEGVDQIGTIPDGATEIFMRLGSDFEENYYEYRLPLALSRDGATTENYARELWKEANDFDFPLKSFIELKKQRNAAGAALTERFGIADSEKLDNQIFIKGNPNLGEVKQIMIGVSNPCNDGIAYCIEVWINELRLVGLNQKGGVAALARADFQLADFGSVSLAGSYSGIGFGGIEQNLQDRAREETIGYDIAAELQLGKFFGPKSGVKIPFLAQFSKNYVNPQYDPYDLDLELKEKIAIAPTQEKADSIKDQAKEITTIKSINFAGVRKESTKPGKKPMPWDVSNLTLTYAYTQTTRNDPLIKEYDEQVHQGELDYNFSLSPKYVKPFSKLIKKDKYLKFLTEFNFNPIPNTLGFTTYVDRFKSKTEYRFSSPLASTYFARRFTWDRDYLFKWDLTRSLKFTYNAVNEAVIDELNEFEEPDEQIRKDFIWDNIKDLGRTKNFRHNVNFTYQLPFKHFPFLDFINARAQYDADYSWSAAATNTESLGNVIQNTQSRLVSGDLNLEKLYNKSDYLKRINRKRRPTSRRPNQRAPLQKGKDNSDDKKSADAKKTRTKSKKSDVKVWESALVRPLMMLRKVRFKYEERFGTVIPGYQPESKLFGMSEGFDAPGWGFVLGEQPDDAWFHDAIDAGNNFTNSWITDDIFHNDPVIQSKQKTYNATINLEPWDDFKVDLEFKKKTSEDRMQLIKDTLFNSTTEIIRDRPLSTGSYTVSFFSLKTLFRDIEDVFTSFENNRAAISQRLGTQAGITAEHPDFPGEGYIDGYGRYQKNVMIPAFISAYTDESPDNANLDFRDRRPQVNWKLNYTGLNKLPWFEDRIKKMSIRHGYESTLSVNSYQTNIDFRRFDPFGATNKVQGSFDFYSQFKIPDIVIRESMNPVIGFDMQLENDMSFRVDWNKNRNLRLLTGDDRVEETKTSEYVFGFGYALKDVKLFKSQKSKRKRKRPSDEEESDQPLGNIFGLGNKSADFTNDLVLNFDLSFRDDVTINHELDNGQNIPTRGAESLRIAFTADYTLNERINMILYFDRSSNVPKTSASFPITNTSGGIQIQFSLN